MCFVLHPLSHGASWRTFDFLGFHLHKVEPWKWRGKFYLQRWPSVRAMNSIRTKIRSLTDRRYAGLAMEATVDRLNPVIRGWGNGHHVRLRARAHRATGKR